MILIGDTHGKIERLVKLLGTLPLDEKIVQLGDMGLGFKGVHLPKIPSNFSFIRGNHDDPVKCNQHPNHLGDYGVFKDGNRKVFYLGGAFSIDRDRRVEGISWWSGEELPYEELKKAIDMYVLNKPDIVLTHEAPARAARLLLHGLMGGYFSAKAECSMSRTSEALQQMFDYHKPKYWVFGHYHVDKEFELEGTTFRCCAELSPYKIPEE